MPLNKETKPIYFISTRHLSGQSTVYANINELIYTEQDIFW